MIVWAVACAVLFKTLFAIRALETHTAPMIDDLKRDDLDAARKKASMVVFEGRQQAGQGPHHLLCGGDHIGEPGRFRPLPDVLLRLAGIPGATFLYGSPIPRTAWSAT